MASTAGIYAREFDQLDRYVQVGVAQGKVISVDFPHEPAADAESEHELLDRIEAYLDGEPDDFDDVEVAMTMPTDQRAVLEKVRTIPYGEEGSVEQVALMVPDLDPDEEGTGAQIREALADNPVPLFIPSHRVADAPSGLPSEVEQRLRSLEGL